MSQERAKYGYALIDDTGRVIGIDTLKKEERYEHRFHCPFCHEEMYPTFGIKQIHHFRHIGDICQHQQYLHQASYGCYR